MENSGYCIFQRHDDTFFFCLLIISKTGIVRYIFMRIYRMAQNGTVPYISICDVTHETAHFSFFLGTSAKYRTKVLCFQTTTH